MPVQCLCPAFFMSARSMRASSFRVAILFIAALTNSAAAQSMQSVFRDGKVDGNVRAYFNTREYDYREDEAGFSLGGALRAETGKFGKTSFGLGYYTAQDLGTNSDNPARVNGRLGSDLEVLGEAYVNIEAGKSLITLGRQKINSPFANPGDAFIIPFTFQGYSLTNTSLPNLKFEISYLNEIKNRNSEEFVDVGWWSGNRYGFASPGNTAGTLNIGSIYAVGPVKTELWLSRFSDFFDMAYLFGQYQFTGTDAFKPFIAGQVVKQKDSGDALVGNVDSTLYGLQLGASAGKAKFTFSYNSVAEQSDAFLNGAVLAPYSFSTSPLFTNNMLETFENLDAGDAGKVAVAYAFSSNLTLVASHARFDLRRVVDRNATDMDVTYQFSGNLQGLSLRWRVEVVTADVEAVEQTNHRFQTQFVF